MISTFLQKVDSVFLIDVNGGVWLVATVLCCGCCDGVNFSGQHEPIAALMLYILFKKLE
ncbi:hypothetical protein [Cupriavidus pauculus]|uniref:hypothetical protein n=1 Tax=Cupriavidus pauculus TaxID=82633 RepID=UPI001EE18430|nr:hypothetical protein [Cupriavidus pauculus]GJG94891.1 hypothetical protein CBA19C6_10400 [Cupriavidus pauculus]